MKKKFTLLVAGLCFSLTALSQAYCSYTSAPYSSNQPGITNFKLGSINRTSANIEGGNALVLTGVTVTLTIGQTYSFSLLTSDDLVSGAPLTGAPQNVRIYVDFNKDFDFVDAGETAFTVDNITPAVTYTNTNGVTVPATVTPGTTKMRVTAKMGSTAGHTAPSPCNVPVDPAGYHGEMEEYTVVFVSGGVGISENNLQKINASLAPNPFNQTAQLIYQIEKTASTSVVVYNILGEKVAVLLNEEQNAGTHQITIDKNKFSKGGSGIYFVELTSGNDSYRTRIIVTE